MRIKNWHPQISALFKTPLMQNLEAFLQKQERAGKIIYPAAGTRFRAFELSKFADTKVVILGQDPYHQQGQAHGLSFSVPAAVKIPPSLKNIYQELTLDLGIPANDSGNLERWAAQGVLLLNSVLTVEKNTPGAHANSGWVDFTDSVISILNEQKENLVFMLWGVYAQQKTALIDPDKHLILSAAHPSPFSAHKGFFGCQHFSKANEYLKMHHRKIINW